jgi:hypothetical protein
MNRCGGSRILSQYCVLNHICFMAKLFLYFPPYRPTSSTSGKLATAASSRAQDAQALNALETGRTGFVLKLGEQGARAALRRLCSSAGVTYQAMHSLRHQAGTRLYRQTG